MIPPRASMPVGIVIRRTPGVTRWARWHWRAVAVLPGAEPADWRELRREGDAVEYHAGTLMIDLYPADCEAYVEALTAQEPSVYVILRTSDASDREFDLLMVTASPFEAQDYTDSGEEIVERVPMPPTLKSWLEDFVRHHHEPEAFIKRKRDRKRIDLKEDGKGDPRVRQVADVYRAPTPRKKVIH